MPLDYILIMNGAKPQKLILKTKLLEEIKNSYFEAGKMPLIQHYEPES